MVNEDFFESYEPARPATSSERKDRTTPAKPRVAVPLTTSFEQGGRSCSRCGRILPHADMLGEHDPAKTSFKIYGYYCSECENRYLYPKYVGMESRSSNRFRTMSKWELAFWQGSDAIGKADNNVV